MSLRIRFNKAHADGVVLARVGHPHRDEPLETSREICRIDEADREMLTRLFLKPFKNLEAQAFHHHSSLENNEVYACTKAVFESEAELLARGCAIAKRLYAKTNHPNIKSGDLCIALIKDIRIDGESAQGICILKSEKVEPFLSIRERDGDLQLTTEHGINPENIDKGCLVLDRDVDSGYHVLTFDRAGGQSQFWMRDFLSLRPISDESFLTNQYAGLAVDVLQEQEEHEGGGVPERAAAAKRAMDYFDNREHFSMQEFEEEVLRKDPEMVAKFQEHKARIEEESGQALKESFDISRKDLNRAMRRVGGVMKFDTGVEIRLLPEFQESAMERGFDEKRGMDYVKVYYHSNGEPQPEALAAK
ncbi:MAG: nucleoid-associated protein [Akkermansiaceae bacterium]|nr:nucleoid-associated protein [Akkermansiaceae bacterium]